METSDDPILTPAILGLGIYGAVQASRGSKAAIPSVQAEQAKATAEPTVQLSEQAKRNRRLAASMLTKDFSEPTLSIPALLG